MQNKIAWPGPAGRAARPLNGDSPLHAVRCLRQLRVADRTSRGVETRARTVQGSVKGARGCRASAEQTPAAGWTDRAAGAMAVG